MTPEGGDRGEVLDDDLAHVRRSYDGTALDIATLPTDEREDPLLAVRRWLDEAVAAEGEAEPTAMTLSTVEVTGAGPLPDARVVLCKGIDHGLVFHTSRASAKGRQLADAPVAAATFLWATLERQLRVRGHVEVVDDATSDAYFATRPRGSQLGAWASTQSHPVADRDEIEARAAEAAARFEGAPVPRPPHWGGYRLVPEVVELWQGRADRLHDRIRWRRADTAWRIERLHP